MAKSEIKTSTSTVKRFAGRKHFIDIPECECHETSEWVISKDALMDICDDLGMYHIKE